jgi:phosphate transport system substrate-binding protein
MKKVIGLIAAMGLMTSPFIQAGTAITVSGSTSVTNVMEVLGETYKQATNKNVEVQGTGSSAGIRAAKDGTSMIGMSSRDIKDSEKTADTKEIVIARDGIAVTTNNQNPVQNLTKAEISKIYRGEIKNWNEVGGENTPIVVVTRDAASGTRGAFEDIMGLKRKVNDMDVSAITASAQVGNGNGMIKTIVANNPYAIGYISLGSVDDSLNALSVDGFQANDANIATGDYAIARPFIVMVKQDVAPQANQFIDYILSEDGQKVVTEQGYISVN